MIDQEISDAVNEITSRVNTINVLMDQLYKKNVEIRISYKDSEKGNPPRLEVWRAVEHVDYLKKDTENE